MELIETNDYTICNDTLIFKPEFNKRIDKYADLIQNYTQIIFSNYEDLEALFETNRCLSKYINKFKQNQFNKQFKLNQNLTHLTFGHNFNQKIQLNQNLTHLTFGENFN